MSSSIFDSDSNSRFRSKSQAQFQSHSQVSNVFRNNSGSVVVKAVLGVVALALGGLILFSFSKGCNHQPGIGYNQGYQPEQPIPFDHSLHAGQNQIQCKYCHNQVERSTHSNIPALSTCMNCHLVVKTDSPLIQKMREAYDKGDSIPWVKVHMLPDHVKFNHSAHLEKIEKHTGEIACKTCHGPIETMKVVYQHSTLSMGWCVNCHREPQYSAPLNCSTCHH